MTALVEYLTVLLEYIDIWGTQAKGKMQQLPPPVGGPEFNTTSIMITDYSRIF